MYPIVFNLNESYVPYASVLMTSIIQNTNKDSNVAGGGAYNFHLLMDFVSQETKEKLQNLILELSKIYPCTLNIHILEDDYFVAYSLKKHKGKYLAYYRLKIGSILPQSITKCVYLDVDMLVLGDLRELFAIDLKGKICGVVMEYNSQKIFKPKDKTYKTLDITGSYFNSGMLLVDLYLWRKEGIEDKAFGFSKSYYYFLHDQDLLNLALYEKTYKIGMEWNFMVYVYYRAICADERGRRKLPYRRQEFNYSLKNIKIMHYFAYSKPWEDGKIYLDYHNKFLGQYWWDMVEQTPIFKEELLEKKPQADNALSFQCYLGYKLLRLYQKGLFLTIPFYTYFLIAQKDSMKIEEIPLQDYNLSREIGRIAFGAYGKRRRGKLISLPFRILHTIKNFKKNQAKIFKKVS